jgi:hypothetical protein
MFYLPVSLLLFLMLLLLLPFLWLGLAVDVVALAAGKLGFPEMGPCYCCWLSWWAARSIFPSTASGAR